MSPSVPTKAKAVYYEKAGDFDVVKFGEQPVRPIKDGEILVKAAYAGVNFIDNYYRTGLYPVSFPFIPGGEGSGIVVKSNAPNFSEGQEVVYMAEACNAEYVAVNASRALAIPKGLALDTAAAALLQGLTAITLIKESYEVKPGDWILVTAAAGGMGLLLTQMIKAYGGKVIGTASTEEKLKLVKEHGGDVVVNSNDDVLKVVLEATNGKGVVAVIDGVGKDTFEVALEAVALKGTVISYGNASGAVPPFSIARLGAKNIKLMRPRLPSYLVEPGSWEKYTGLLFGLIQDKKVKVNIYKEYPATEFVQAQKDITGRKSTGKLLIKY